LITKAGKKIASVNAMINRDVGSEAVAKTGSVNVFCPPR
jgi:hypothetical protein